MSVTEIESGNAAPNPTSTKKRGRKPGVQPKVRLGIPDEFLKFTELDEQETAEARRKREPRSEQQKYIDNIVLDLWSKYVDRGEPKNWADKPVFSWGPLPVNYEEDALFMIRKACLLYGRRQVLGERTYTEIDGIKMVTIPFSVERRVSKNKPN